MLITGTRKPISPVRLVRRLRAAWLIENPASAAAASTRSRVADATSGESLSTRETVVLETPAWAARSMIVGGRSARVGGTPRIMAALDSGGELA